MKPYLKNILLWLVIVLIFLTTYKFLSKFKPIEEVPFSSFLDSVKKGQIKEVIINGEEIEATIKGEKEKKIKTYAPEYPDLIKILAKRGVVIKVKPSGENSLWRSVFVGWVPILILIAVWIFFMRNLQTMGTKATTFGKAKAKLFDSEKQKITFDDVADIEEAKEEVKEIVEFLKAPKRFSRLGAKIPKGVLLVGAPGTGKTLLARAIAGEAKVPFFSVSGSDFVEIFVGVGASRVRDLFEQAKKNSPCIIFIDEIDAVGRLRGAGLGGGHDEREQTLNQLLVEMDGIEMNEGLIVIAATNRPDILDPALLRPGRFDRRVIVPKPDMKGREKILKVHTKNVPIAKNVNLKIIARGTPGFAGADLANLVNEAALIAAKKGKSKITMKDMEEAKDKILMGKERRSLVISEEEKRITAYHEAGHTLVAKFVPNADPIHKVSIIPRGLALGVTQQLPQEDKFTHSKEYLLDRLTVLLGGRAAEEVALNTFTTGAANDLETATELARKMVCEWGMNEKIGPVTLGKLEQHIFLGKELGRQQNYSDKTAETIDNEIRNLIENCYERSKRILIENREALNEMARLLIEKEVLEAKDIDLIIKSKSTEKEKIKKELHSGTGS